MRLNTVIAWVVAVLAGLTAVGSILAGVFGASTFHLALASTLVLVVATPVALKLLAKQDEKELAQAQRQQQLLHQQQLKLQEQEKLEREKELTLDRDCAALLRKAKTAVQAILASEACKNDLIEPPVDKKRLGDNVQAILAAGREITDLRAEINSIIDLSSSEKTTTGRALAGPMTSAVIRPQRQALERVLNSASSRVSNLERYASTVKAVDVTYKDWIGAQKAERLNDRVRNLYIRTVEDELAAQELNSLAERAAAAEQAFLQSLEEANLAAETLALPDEERPLHY
jgi:hypothetical protein